VADGKQPTDFKKDEDKWGYTACCDEVVVKVDRVPHLRGLSYVLL